MKKMNVKFVPRTGIDQPFMIQAPKFIETTKEFERNATVNVSLKCHHPSHMTLTVGVDLTT